MAYSELIKNFDRIRSYMRDFYVYGFKSRSEYSQKSARSYDNERRRIESWLGDYMSFRQTPSGKNVFLSFDSRYVRHNPLYKAFKTKSFTDGDITLHFLLFDLLSSPNVKMTVAEIAEALDTEYLSAFDEPMLLDESTIRKKLKEYVSLGLLKTEKSGKSVYYSRSSDTSLEGWSDAIAFFSEAAPLGVVGSYLLDRLPKRRTVFSFKHHYITHTLESEILYAALEAMHEKKTMTVRNFSRHAMQEHDLEVVPLKIFISVQSGRRYLLAKNLCHGRIVPLRLDYILSAKSGSVHEEYDAERKKLEEIRPHMWGVSGHENPGHFEHVSFTLRLFEGEEHIVSRLEREKRCGTVTRLDEHHIRFDADVCDTNEMFPWIRTFICRITELDFENKAAEKRFREDLESMYRLYGIGGENV